MFGSILALALLMFPSNISGWGVYKPEGKNFEIGVPGPWKVYVVTSDLVRITPAVDEEWMLGVKLPASPIPWVDVHAPLNGTCKDTRQSGDFKKFPASSGTFFREKVICRSGVVVSLGYWENKNGKEQKKVLEQMLKSFKTLSWEK